MNGINGKNFKQVYTLFKENIKSICAEYEYLRTSDKVKIEDRDTLKAISKTKASYGQWANSLLVLTRALHDYHGIRTIVLLDEYDVLFSHAHQKTYYDEISIFLQSFLSLALKSNTNLKFAVLTGCLRVAKESIFTGLNNFICYDPLSFDYADAFGFTDSEVRNLLKECNLADKIDEVRQWYDGYQFGNINNIYCPWSVTNYIHFHTSQPDEPPQPYWVNTSANDFWNELAEENFSWGAENFGDRIEQLLNGKFLEVKLNKFITYKDLYLSQNNFWTIMYYSGYLAKVSKEQLQNRDISQNEDIIILKIPNKEIFKLWHEYLKKWLGSYTKKFPFVKFYNSFWNQEENIVAKELENFMLNNLSYFDLQEYAYQIMIDTLFSTKYDVKSNRESGNGRFDIAVYDNISAKKRASIIEIKVTNNENLLDTLAEKALKQIATKKYDTDLRAAGFKNILHWGIAFCGKTCKAKVRSISHARAYKRLPDEF